MGDVLLLETRGHQEEILCLSGEVAEQIDRLSGGIPPACPTAWDHEPEFDDGFDLDPVVRGGRAADEAADEAFLRLLARDAELRDESTAVIEQARRVQAVSRVCGRGALDWFDADVIEQSGHPLRGLEASVSDVFLIRRTAEAARDWLTIWRDAMTTLHKQGNRAARKEHAAESRAPAIASHARRSSGQNAAAEETPATDGDDRRAIRRGQMPARVLSAIKSHKYDVGQVVNFLPGKSVFETSPGVYEVLIQLPPDGSENQYRVRSAEDGHERVVRENQLA
jgi:hypothetical protein